MKLAVVGTGKVGTSLLHHLAVNELASEIMVMSRHADNAKAAIMQVASAYPAHF